MVILAIRTKCFSIASPHIHLDLPRLEKHRHTDISMAHPHVVASAVHPYPTLRTWVPKIMSGMLTSTKTTRLNTMCWSKKKCPVRTPVIPACQWRVHGGTEMG
jgi:hypothetical protein